MIALNEKLAALSVALASSWTIPWLFNVDQYKKVRKIINEWKNNKTIYKIDIWPIIIDGIVTVGRWMSLNQEK